MFGTCTVTRFRFCRSAGRLLRFHTRSEQWPCQREPAGARQRPANYLSNCAATTCGVPWHDCFGRSPLRRLLGTIQDRVDASEAARLSRLAARRADKLAESRSREPPLPRVSPCAVDSPSGAYRKVVETESPAARRTDDCSASRRPAEPVRGEVQTHTSESCLACVLHGQSFARS